MFKKSLVFLKEPTMGSHFVARPAALYFILAALLALLSLLGCSEWSDSDASTRPQLSGEWVDVNAMFKNPKDFADCGRLQFYLTRVGGLAEPMLEDPDYLEILSGDTRQYDSKGDLVLILTPAAKTKWASSQLGGGSLFQYGVTFSGEVKPRDDSLHSSYIFLADSFDINDEMQSWQDLDPRKLDFEYRPSQVLALPRPITVADSKRLSMVAKDFIGQKIRFNLAFMDEDIQVSKTGKSHILKDDLSLVLNESAVRSLLTDKKKSIFSAHVVGRVLNERDEGGRLRIEVDSLELHP